MGVTHQMANEIRGNIDIRGEQVAAAKLKKVGDAAEKAGDSLDEMGGQATDAGKATEKSGDKLRGTADDADFLNRKIIELSESYKGMVAEFARTGDESILKDASKERGRLRKFENFAKDLIPKPEAVSVGKDAGASIIGGIRAGLSSGGPALTGVLAGIAVAAAPGLAAIIGGAIVGGVGAGGIIGGIAIAAQDTRVQAVGQQVGQSLTEEFKDAASGFTEPVIQSLQKLGGIGLGDRLGPTFDKLAKKVDPLTNGLIGFIDGVIPGLEKLADAAGPSLDVLAEGLPKIGTAIGEFFGSISDDPGTAADGLETFIDVTVDAITTAGDFIEVLIGIYSISRDVADALGLIEEEETRLGGAIRKGSTEVENFVEHTAEAEQALKDFNTAIGDVFGRTLDVRDATLQYEQSIDDLVEELTDGERTLKANTQAGRDNWGAINDVAQAIERQREANVANGMSMDEASAKYDRQLEDLRKTLLNLGYNKEAVNKYIAELKKVPTQALTEVYLKGIKVAIADAKELAGVLGGIAGYGVQAAISGPGRRASGGPVSTGQSYIVGENGPELLTMGGGSGHVYNAGQTEAMMSGSSGGSSRQVVNLAVTLVDPITGAVMRRALINDALARGIPEDDVRSAYP